MTTPRYTVVTRPIEHRAQGGGVALGSGFVCPRCGADGNTYPRLRRGEVILAGCFSCGASYEVESVGEGDNRPWPFGEAR